MTTGRPQIGFQTVLPQKEVTDKPALSQVRPEDLIKYGLKPELIGRLPALGMLHPLAIKDLTRILTTAESSPIQSYAQILKARGYDLEIEPSVLEEIARRCPKETGARALQAVCHDLFSSILYDPQSCADNKRVVHVTSDLAKERIHLYA